MTKYLSMIAVLLMALSTGAAAEDLFFVSVSDNDDIELISSLPVDPVLRSQGGYLLLIDPADVPVLEQSGLESRRLEGDISRLELAYDLQFDDRNIGRYSLVFREGSLRVFRVSPEASPQELQEDRLRSLENLHPKLYVQKARPLSKRRFTATADLDSLIDKISEDSLFSYTQSLQAFDGRVAGTSRNRSARDWIAARLADFGLDSVILQPFQAYVNGVWQECWNVLGYRTGTVQPGKHIVVGAHFDAVPGSPGADDNGSGTAAVMEMARVMGTIQTDMTFVFALFDAEEWGLYGSEYYAQQAAARGDDIEYMLNLDMIAYYPNSTEAKLYHGPELAYTNLWQQIAGPVAGITGYLEGSSSSSDHFYFIQQGYEATFVHEQVFSTVYHSFQDSTTYMDFDYFTRMTKVSFATVWVINNGLFFSGNVTTGMRPLDVSFTSWSIDPVSTWSWEFGDGGSSGQASPNHVYEEAGLYTVSLDATMTSGNRSMSRSDYILALDDDMSGTDVAASPEQIVEVTVTAKNTISLRQLVIPVEIGGDLPLTYQSFSTEGCRTANFNSQSLIHLDPFNDRRTIQLRNTNDASQNLAPGSGPIVKLYFYNSETSSSGRSGQIIFDGYSSFLPTFTGPLASYHPDVAPATVTSGCCVGMRGNANGSADDAIDVSDLTFLVNFMFSDGPEPPCPQEADVDNSGDTNIVDLTYYVSFMFRDGPLPLSCN